MAPIAIPARNNAAALRDRFAPDTPLGQWARLGLTLLAALAAPALLVAGAHARFGGVGAVMIVAAFVAVAAGAVGLAWADALAEGADLLH